MSIEIRRVQTHSEYRAVEGLQCEIWNLDDVEIVPDHVLLTAQNNGGLVLGAFDRPPGGEERLVGFAFGFVGLSADGSVKHCSHMAGVASGYHNQDLGYRLKVAQRQHVLTQYIDHVTWTFDPLESRNAHLNFHKLGVTCRTYLPDLYGSIRDGLNAGLPSDRFQVDWHVVSTRVIERLTNLRPAGSPAVLQADGIPALNDGPADALQTLPQTTRPLAGERVLIRIPANFQAIKAADMALAQRWRLHTRELFTAAFDSGYAVTDLLFDGQQSYYLLEKP